jgi:hypothetical protein
MDGHDASLPADLVLLRDRAEHAERELRAVIAQREVLATVLRQLLDGASPEMIAAVTARTEPGAG